jgi:hypothetical protein
MPTDPRFFWHVTVNTHIFFFGPRIFLKSNWKLVETETPFKCHKILPFGNISAVDEDNSVKYYHYVRINAHFQTKTGKWAFMYMYVRCIHVVSVSTSFQLDLRIILGPKKNICVFTVTCQKNLGSVGINLKKKIFFYYRQNQK